MQHEQTTIQKASFDTDDFIKSSHIALFFKRESVLDFLECSRMI